MAEVDNITMVEVAPLGLEIARCQLTGATSTYTSKRFANVTSFQVQVEGTNTCTITRSTITLTITGTNDDWVNVILTGTR